MDSTVKKERYKINVAVYAIIVRDGKILLSLRQGSGFFDGEYSFVSGHLESEETLAEAMIREAREEANINITKMRIGTVLFRFRPDKNYNNYLDCFFIIDEFEGEINNNEPTKCAELKFYPLENMPENTIDYVKFSLKNALSGIMYGEYKHYRPD
ncbi:MAG: NUDIX domain-containing protein [Rickettsiales bacterium]|jgi:8-oxo-dGTP pyrophosphatase MutT (NUDIX family)|nr:NUDIX domain-containing protein [Rickettsiales bacterium]